MLAKYEMFWINLFYFYKAESNRPRCVICIFFIFYYRPLPYSHFIERNQMSSSKSKGGEQRKRETSPDRKPNNKDNTPKKSLDDSDEDKGTSARKNIFSIQRELRFMKMKLLKNNFLIFLNYR